MRSLRTFWVFEVESPETLEVTLAEPLAVAARQIAAEVVQQGFAVIRTRLFTLLKLDDMRADFPVGLGEVDVNGMSRTDLTNMTVVPDATLLAFLRAAAVPTASVNGWMFEE